MIKSNLLKILLSIFIVFSLFIQKFVFANTGDLWITDLDSFRSVQESDKYIFYEDISRNIKKLEKTTGRNSLFIPSYKGRTKRTYLSDTLFLYDAGSVYVNSTIGNKDYLYQTNLDGGGTDSGTGVVFQDLMYGGFQKILKETDSAYYYSIGGKLFKKVKGDTGVTGNSVFPIDYAGGMWYDSVVIGDYCIIRTGLNNYYKFDFTTDTYTLLFNSTVGSSFIKASDSLLIMNLQPVSYKWNPSTNISTKQLLLTGSVFTSNETATGIIYGSGTLRYKLLDGIKTNELTNISYYSLLNKETFLYSSGGVYLRDYKDNIGSGVLITGDTSVLIGKGYNLQYTSKWMFPSLYEQSLFYATGSNLYRIKTPSWIIAPVAVFQGTEIYNESTFSNAGKIADSSLTDSQKNSILYSTGGLLNSTGSISINLYNSNNIPAIDSVNNNVWKIKMGNYIFVAKKAK